MKNHTKPFLFIAIILIFGCEQPTLDFKKEMKRIKGTWKMVSIEKREDMVDFYPSSMIATFKDCKDNEFNCEALLAINDSISVSMVYKMGEKGGGGVAIIYHSHEGGVKDSLASKFIENINWFIQSNNGNEIELTNSVAGYRLKLQKQ
jgi:hypothetical protein